MSYALEPDEYPGEGVARMVAEQVDKLRELSLARRDDPVLFVHKARVRCKRIRAALRLGRGLLGDHRYHAENAFWRDAAGGMSGVRDLSARIEALEALKPVLPAAIGATAVAQLAERFTKEREAFSVQAADAPLAAFCAAIAVRDTDIGEHIAKGDVDAIADALGEGYGAARTAMKAALAGGTPELFHEWRKKTKYHALQARMARKLFPALEARVVSARELGEHLGAVQDIEVVIQGLNPRATRMRRVLDERRAVMMTEAFAAGRALFELKRKAWVSQMMETPEPVDAERVGEDA